MIHLESLICYSCQTSRGRNLFDESNRRAIVGTCGHSVCLSCSKLDPNRSCPICHKANAFTHGTVNYEAMNQIEFYKENAFRTFRKWWETFTTSVGVCSKCASQEVLRICSTCQRAQNLKDVSLVGSVMCEPCADRMVERTNGIHQCDRMSGYEHIHCIECGNETDNPQICTICFHNSTNHINLDAFSLCAGCIIDYHKGHDVLKAAEDYNVRHNTVDIIRKLLEAKLDTLTKLKCKLRKMRLDLTGQDFIYWTSTHYPLYTEENCPDKKLIGRPKIVEKRIPRILESLEKQFDQLLNLQEICHCVDVWKELERLNFFDMNRMPPHFTAMCLKPNVDEGLEMCPYDLESSQEWRDQLLEIIGRGEMLAEPLEKIFVFKPSK